LKDTKGLAFNIFLL